MNDNSVQLAPKLPAATPEGFEAAQALHAEMVIMSRYAERAIEQAALDIGRQEQNPATAFRVIARRALQRLAEIDGPEAAGRYARSVGDFINHPGEPAAG